MNKNAWKTLLLLEPETKTWARVLDATLVLLATIFAAALFFFLPLEIDHLLLRTSFWGAILSTPVLAYALFRNATLLKIERLAFVVLVYSLTLALMMASFESSRSI